jgi:putative Ca2+/H+ antiporter (TMEM165/GDT1 family)
VIAGTFAAFAAHVVLAVTCGSLLGLLPHKIVQIAVAVVFLAGAVVLLRADKDDDDEIRSPEQPGPRQLNGEARVV